MTEPPDPLPAQLDPADVLLIDDDDLVADSLRDYLRRGGLVVDSARDRIEAETLMRSRRYRGILVDPVLTGGSAAAADVVAAIRAAQPAAEVILVTDYPSREIAQLALDQRVSRLMTKPRSVPLLASLVQDMLGPARPARRNPDGLDTTPESGGPIKMRRAFIFVTLAFIATTFAGSAGCRSRVKPVAAPPAPAAVAETTPREVAAPQRDFVAETPEDPILTGDLDALNRTAHARGWIRDAFFGFDSTALDSESRRALDASAQWLRENPGFGLTIEGHCDERGTQQYNLALGERRASVAFDYLAALGIDSSRLRTISLGEERPFMQGSDEDAWSQNRRAHLVLFRR
ncbi:MAG TPA: OmpA family protein [Thermoanaerobaculia bacterium]|nr:OmpA family protein [Thermoanaerobaculia bacterium]